MMAPTINQVSLVGVCSGWQGGTLPMLKIVDDYHHVQDDQDDDDDDKLPEGIELNKTVAKEKFYNAASCSPIISTYQTLCHFYVSAVFTFSSEIK